MKEMAMQELLGANVHGPADCTLYQLIRLLVTEREPQTCLSSDATAFERGSSSSNALYVSDVSIIRVA
jgi:hypothetical protein